MTLTFFVDTERIYHNSIFLQIDLPLEIRASVSSLKLPMSKVHTNLTSYIIYHVAILDNEETLKPKLENSSVVFLLQKCYLFVITYNFTTQSSATYP